MMPAVEVEQMAIAGNIGISRASIAETPPASTVSEAQGEEVTGPEPSSIRTPAPEQRERSEKSSAPVQPLTVPEPESVDGTQGASTPAAGKKQAEEDVCDAILCGGNPLGDAGKNAAENGESQNAVHDPETVIVVNGQTIDEIANNTSEIEKKCREIWEGADTLEKITDFVQERHFGDTTPIKMILLAAMQHRITTISELTYISVNAESGGGKSDLVRSIAEILPADSVKIGTASAKFLPRMGAKWDGKIIFLDDQQPDADNIEYMKVCGANGTVRPAYCTLVPGAKGEPAYKAEELPLPMRLCYIIARVDTAWGTDAEQVQNRIISVYLDDSEEQRQRVLARMIERMQVDYVDRHQKTAEGMREKLWTHIPEKISVDLRDIRGHINARNVENRMYGHLLNMIASNAVYRQWPGSEELWAGNGPWLHGDAASHTPIIYATKDDAIPILDLFNSFLTIPADGKGDANAGGNVYKFSKGEKRVHDAILQKYPHQPKEWKSVREMAMDLDIPPETLRVALKGRKPSRNAGATEGLLSKMPGLDTVQTSKSVDNTPKTPDEFKEWERNRKNDSFETGPGDGRTTRTYEVITWVTTAYDQDRKARCARFEWKD